MGKVTGFLEIDRQDRRYALASDRIRPGLTLASLSLCCVIVSSAVAHACRITQYPPGEAILRAPPRDAAFAAKAIIRRINADWPILGTPHSDFRLELQVVQLFKGEAGSVITVTYGPCHDVPGEVGETINVLARIGYNGELVAY
jgi:hypothetical protein